MNSKLEDFKALKPNTLLKVFLTEDKGLVRDRVGRIQDHVYGFMKNKSDIQYLILTPRSYDDRITHNVIEDRLHETPYDAEFFVSFNDIERFEVVWEPKD